MKKIISLILAVAFAAVAFPVGAAAEYADVAAGRWSYDDIAYATDAGYMQGVGGGEFDPTGAVTRAAAVTVLWRMAGSPAPRNHGMYGDVEAGAWYEDAALWANAEGVAVGVADRTFAPDEPVTREQFAVMLSRFAALSKLLAESDFDLSAFPDAGSVSEYAARATAWAVEDGVILGSAEPDGAYLLPGAPLTREQLAAVLRRYDGVKGSLGHVLEYNHPVLMSEYTEKEYPLVTDADFYVSPTGDDSAAGDFAHPFATFARAAEAVRTLPKTAEQGGVTVAFFAGDYPAPGIELTAADAGTAECPVTYCAYGDGEVRFIGGVTVSPDSFVPLDGEDRALFRAANADHIKKAPLTGALADGIDWLSETFTLSYGRLDAARFPNRDESGDEMYIKNLAKSHGRGYMSVSVMKNRWARYHTYEGIRIIGCIGDEYWQTVFPVTGYDKETNIISYDIIGPQYGIYEYAQEIYFLNISEELDCANESWIDPATKTLYVYEPKDEEYFVSTVESFGTIDGADHVTFRGLSFYACKGDGITVTADGVEFDRCTIFGIGGRAGLRCTGVDFRMQDSTFAYTAGCGMWFDSGRPVEDLVPTGPYVDNCLIHDMGQLWKNLQNPGIRLKRAVGAVVSHCELYNTPCAAISYGYCAEGGEERAIDCVFEYNYIHDVDRDVVDIGCIYSGRSFVNRDNIFRYNLISDIPGSGGRFAIYLDDGLAAQKIYGNIFYDFTDTAIMHSGGQYMDIHDNVYVRAHTPSYGDVLTALSAWDKYYNFRYDDDGQPTGSPWESGNFRILYGTLAKRPAEGSEYYGLWHDRWPELYGVIDDYDDVENPNCPATPGFCSIYNNYAIGYCKNSIGDAVTRFAVRCENNRDFTHDENPLFVDPTVGDYRIRDDVEDFMKIPFEKIGRY